MGIRGLETMLDSIYNTEHSSKVFTRKKLKDLRLVIDGNQLAYLLSNIFKCGHYGGHYDYLYEKVKKFLFKLKNSIEIIIFDGGKENINKSMGRLERKIETVGNFPDITGYAESQDEHLLKLYEYLSLFNKMIFFKIISELGIKYAMVDGLADHAIALYANGVNDSNKKFTVFSKASFFNVYDLSEGYLCSSNALKQFENVDSLDENTEFSVFYLSKLLSFAGFTSQLTWIYCCILMGNRDDADLNKNINYFREHRIETRKDLTQKNLLDYLKKEESNMLANNFEEIRSTYKSNETLAKIDELIELFQMKNTSYKFLISEGGDFLNDYDRWYSTLNKIQCDFIYCSVEDFQNEASSFFPANVYLKILYSHICQNNPNIKEIKQYSRCKNPSRNLRLRLNTLTREQILSHNNNNKFMNFLHDVNTKMNSINAKDDLTLFYVSLLIWNEYLITKLDNNESSSLYVTSIIYNLVLIVLKKALNLQKDSSCESIKVSREIDLLQSNMIHFVLLKIKEDKEILSKVEQMVSTYDEVCDRMHDLKSTEASEYFQSDIPVIHRIAEFQAIYYVIGAINKINKYKFELLIPNCFLNCYFVCKMVQSKEKTLVDLKRALNEFKLSATLIEQCQLKLEICKNFIN